MIRTAIFLAIVGYTVAQNSELCQPFADNRNAKNLYADSEDCHAYIQCFFVNDTLTIGIRQRCPEGQFWHDQVLSCMPEGETPCVDRCMEDAVGARGCYAGNTCNAYYTCSNTGSFGMCCPEGTEFVEASCSCETSETCADICIPPSPAIPTTVAPATQFNATVCEDSFGALVATDPEPNAFHLIDEEGQSTGKQYCAEGTDFNFETCRCDIENGEATVPTQVLRQASFFANFDDASAGDSSVHNHATFLANGAEQDSTGGAQGSGSLAVNGGSMVVPAFKTWDGRVSASWSFFYRCAGSCSGGIISLRGDTRSVVIGVTGNSLSAYIGLWRPEGSATVQSAATSNGWHHVAVTYGDSTLRFYHDGQMRDETNIGGYLALGHDALQIGADVEMGSFNGNVDEVCIAPFAFTQEEVNALYTGDYGFLESLGFF